MVEGAMKPAGHPAGKTMATPGIAPAGGFGGLGEDPSHGEWHTVTGNSGAPRPFLPLRAQSDTDPERDTKKRDDDRHTRA